MNNTQKKMKIIQTMADVINKKRNKLISHSLKGLLEQEKDRLEFRLKEADKEFNEEIKKLTELYTDKELDLKIESFKKAIELLKNV